MARLRVSDAYLDHAFVKFDTVRGPKQAPFAPIRAFLCRSDLYGGFVRARGALSLNSKNGGFRPLVPPPVWSTIYDCRRLLVPVSQY